MPDHQMRLDGGADVVRPARAAEFHKARIPEDPFTPENAPWTRTTHQQLPVVLTAREIYQTLHLGDQSDYETGREIMGRKYAESQVRDPLTMKSLAQHLSESQFSDVKPIHVYWGNGSVKPTVADGHHRLSVMLQDAPDTPMAVSPNILSPEEKRQVGNSPRTIHNRQDAYLYDRPSFDHVARNPAGAYLP